MKRKAPNEKVVDGAELGIAESPLQLRKALRLRATTVQETRMLRMLKRESVTIGVIQDKLLF
jgi:hypothetical protein